MPRTRLVLSFLAVLAAGAFRPLGAQQSQQPQDSAVRVDSTTRVRQLAPMVITAEKQKVSRAGVLALMEENRRLAGVLAAHDRRVEQLAARLRYLQTTVTDSVTREIAQIDGAAAETRARRLALEARLAALEGTQSANTMMRTEP
jgi:uncharacterized coiled-coil protein SlyX